MRTFIFLSFLSLASAAYAQSPAGELADSLAQMLILMGDSDTRQQVIDLQTLKALQNLQQRQAPAPSTHCTINSGGSIFGERMPDTVDCW